MALTKKTALIAIRILIASATFWVISRFVDLAEAAQVIIRAEPAYVITAIVMIGPFALLEGGRWQSVMRALGWNVPLLTAVKYTLVGWFFNNLTPANTGQDIFRAIQMKRVGMDLGQAINSVVVFRLASLWCLLLIVAVTLPFAIALTENWANASILAVIAGGAGCAMAGFLSLHQLQRIAPRFFSMRFVAMLLTPSIDTKRILFRSTSSPAITILGVSVHLWRVLMIYILALAIGIDPGYFSLVMVVPIALLVAMLPITINDWGTREAAFAFFLPWISMSAEQAVALSVIFGLLRICNGLPGAFVWLLLDKEAYAISRAQE